MSSQAGRLPIIATDKKRPNTGIRMGLVDVEISATKKATEIGRLRAELTDMHGMIREYRRQEELMSEAVKSQQIDLTNAVAEKNQLEKRLIIVTQDRNGVQTRLKRSLINLTEKEEMITEMDSELCKRGRELNEKGAKNKELRKHFEDAIKERETIDAQLKGLKLKNYDLVKMSHHLEDEKRWEEDKIKRLKMAQKYVSEKLELSEGNASDLTKKLQEAEKKIEDLEKTGSESSISSMSDEVRGLRSQMSLLTLKMEEEIPRRVEQVVEKKMSHMEKQMSEMTAMMARMMTMNVDVQDHVHQPNRQHSAVLSQDTAAVIPSNESEDKPFGVGESLGAESLPSVEPQSTFRDCMEPARAESGSVTTNLQNRTPQDVDQSSSAINSNKRKWNPNFQKKTELI